MKGVGSLSGLLLPVVAVVSLLAATVSPLSANTDDWALVSAPPPPGPYRAVNLDPRIPRADGIPMIRKIPGPSQASENRLPPGALRNNGRSNNYPVPPQVPGNYQSMMSGPPPNVRYPMYPGRQYNAMMPPQGNFPAPSYPPEQVVPPPPVYDAMMRSPPAGR